MHPAPLYTHIHMSIISSYVLEFVGTMTSICLYLPSVALLTSSLTPSFPCSLPFPDIQPNYGDLSPEAVDFLQDKDLVRNAVQVYFQSTLNLCDPRSNSDCLDVLALYMLSLPSCVCAGKQRFLPELYRCCGNGDSEWYLRTCLRGSLCVFASADKQYLNIHGCTLTRKQKKTRGLRN